MDERKGKERKREKRRYVSDIVTCFAPTGEHGHQPIGTPRECIVSMDISFLNRVWGGLRTLFWYM